MGLFIDTTETVPHEIEGTVFRIRILTTRQRLRASCAAMRVGEIIRAAGEGEELVLTPEQALVISDAQFEILCIGLEGWGVVNATPDLIDTLAQRAWTPLCNKIMETNSVSEEDSKN